MAGELRKPWCAPGRQEHATHEPLISRVMLAEVPLTGLSLHGVTDDLGVKAVENKLLLYDFNATILHLLGLDNTRLSFRHNGFDRRLTDVHGHVIKEILA
jgi:hypothetical protein